MSPLARSVAELLDRLLQALPANAARLEVRPGKDSTEGLVNFIVTPARPTAATIHVAVADPDIYLSLGRGAVYELAPAGRSYTELEQLDELRALCLAGIRGEFRETVWVKGDDVVGGRGWATVGSAEVGHLWRQAFTNPLRRARKSSHSYQPYVDA
jgi:hypothetical protein